MTNDLQTILGNDFAEPVTLTTKSGSTTSGNAIINIIGESESEWPGGNAMVALILISKAQFAAKPKSNEVFTSATMAWTVDAIVSETPASWTIKAFSEQKPK